MVTNVVESPEKASPPKVKVKPGLATAGTVLEYIEGSLYLINRNKRFEVYPPSEAWLKRSPNLAQRMKTFQSFADSIPQTRFESPWLKLVGGMGVARCNSNGNIHLYLIDDGMLSHSLPMVGTDNEDLNYKERSRFFCNRIFGLDVAGQRWKSRIHLHAFSVDDVIEEALHIERNSVMLAIRNLIAKDHGPDGNYIKRSTLKAFSLKQRCPDGVPMKEHDNLVMNQPGWFQQQMSLWRR